MTATDNNQAELRTPWTPATAPSPAAARAHVPMVELVAVRSAMPDDHDAAAAEHTCAAALVERRLARSADDAGNSAALTQALASTPAGRVYLADDGDGGIEIRTDRPASRPLALAEPVESPEDAAIAGMDPDTPVHGLTF